MVVPQSQMFSVRLTTYFISHLEGTILFCFYIPSQRDSSTCRRKKKSVKVIESNFKSDHSIYIYLHVCEFVCAQIQMQTLVFKDVVYVCCYALNIPRGLASKGQYMINRSFLFLQAEISRLKQDAGSSAA